MGRAKLLRKIRKERKSRIQKLIDRGLIESFHQIPEDSIPVDPDKLMVGYSGKVTDWRLYYVDMPFNCKDCGSHEVWLKESQMWWHEEMRAHRDVIAVRCRDCRHKIRKEKEEQRARKEESDQD